MANLIADFEIGIVHPGLSPVLRAGLGGLACSIRAYTRATGQNITEPIIVGPGTIAVESKSIRFFWNGHSPLDTLLKLFHVSFQIDNNGIIDLPGTYNQKPGIEAISTLQDNLRTTFLQHGKSVQPLGARTTHSVEIDDVPFLFDIQKYSAYNHQKAEFIEAIATSIEKQKPVKLPGWANPGAVSKHPAFADTDVSYDAASALCALFAIVGCVSLRSSSKTGIIIAPEPYDLRLFAETRPLLTPTTVKGCFVSGPGDAILSISTAIRLDDISARSGVKNVRAYVLKLLPWVQGGQKTRCAAYTSDKYTAEELDIYDEIARSLPNKPVYNEKEKISYIRTSAFRALVCENLAERRPWYSNFATAKNASGDRFIHRFREKNNLGALYSFEQKGIINMIQHQMTENEKLVVDMIQEAMRHRFAQIFRESKEMHSASGPRLKRERERVTLALSGSRTRSSFMRAVSQLISKAGPNKTLEKGLDRIFPMLSHDWQTVKDLALLAVAGYPRAKNEETEETKEEQAQ